MQKYNKNIRKNILGIVSKRLLPKNQSLHFTRTSCQQCITQRPVQQPPSTPPIKQVSNTNNSRTCGSTLKQISNQKEMENVNGKSMSRGQLEIFSNLYSLSVVPENKKQLEIEQEVGKVLDINQKEEEENLHIERQQNDQKIVRCIVQWVNYVLDPQKNQQKTLPFEQNTILQELKPKLRDLLHKIERQRQPKLSPQSSTLLFQSQITGTYLFKKSTKIQQVELNQPPSSPIEIKENSEKEMEQVFTYPQFSNQNTSGKSRSGSPSCKLLNSASTISSEKNIVKMSDNCYDEMMRLMVIQACAIESMI